MKIPKEGQEFRLHNGSSLEKVEAKLLPAINDAKEFYISAYGDDLESVYIEGSAGRGDYIEGVSDLDLIGILKRARTDEDRQKLREGQKRLRVKHDLKKLDMGLYERPKLDQNLRPQFILATDGVLVWGEPYVTKLPLPNTKAELAKLLCSPIPKRVEEGEGRLEQEGADLAMWGRWLSKQATRLAYGIALARGAEYTPSMPKLFTLAREHVPELQTEVGLFEEIREQPSESKERYTQLLNASRKTVDLALEVGLVTVDKPSK